MSDDVQTGTHSAGEEGPAVADGSTLALIPKNNTIKNTRGERPRSGFLHFTAD